jgi:hypothetical protein
MEMKGYNIRKSGGISGQWWCCNNGTITIIPSQTPPAGTTPYKTFSTIYSDGHGFWVLRGDATDPPKDETWHHLRFDWNGENLSSSLSNTGAESVMRCHDPRKRWPGMLLPDIYHGPAYPYDGYGGLTGDLPIFLALVALSMDPARLPVELPQMMQAGEWGTHGRLHGRTYPYYLYTLSFSLTIGAGTHKRGVIVYVYSVNGNKDELKAYEDGDLGKYYH